MTPRERAELAEEIAAKVNADGRRGYMGIAEVAKYLAVSEKHVINQKVPFKMIGNRKIYDPKEVDQWVDRDDDRIMFLADVAWGLRMGGYDHLSDRICRDLGLGYDELQEAGAKFYRIKAKNGNVG